jgi:MoaA/NifB/PqqE/SkfB family radical SAM enzyme
LYKITSVWPHQDSVKVEWNLGKRCNYDCTYCPKEIHDNFSPHTDINILEKAVDRLCEIGKPIRISLTGGEPCIYPNIEDLLDYFKRKSISWVSITTNGTRGYSWYLNNEIYFNHLVFSLHFEQKNWHRIFDTILKFYDSTERDFFVNIMAHHDYITNVKSIVKKFNELGVKYAVRRIRWTQGDHNVFDDLRYNGEDLEWLVQQEATAKPNVILDDQVMHANDVIKLHLNQFKGWTCNAGLESLMINWDGEVYRATCRVGSSLGNIYKDTFSVPLDPIICTRDWCTCAADIPLTKIRNDRN